MSADWPPASYAYNLTSLAINFAVQFETQVELIFFQTNPTRTVFFLLQLYSEITLVPSNDVRVALASRWIYLSLPLVYVEEFNFQF